MKDYKNIYFECGGADEEDCFSTKYEYLGYEVKEKKTIGIEDGFYYYVKEHKYKCAKCGDLYFKDELIEENCNNCYYASPLEELMSDKYDITDREKEQQCTLFCELNIGKVRDNFKCKKYCHTEFVESELEKQMKEGN